MDLSASVVRATQFREAKYGYHPTDVDVFMESVAVAIELAAQRARTAAPPVVDDTDPFQRALVGAQLLADELVDAARARAAEIIAAADERAKEIITRADDLAHRARGRLRE